MNQEIKKQFSEHIDTVKNNFHLVEQIELATNMIVECYKFDGKVLIGGNGGSAADSQHISAELVGKFEKKRKAFAAIALSTDTSMLTAWSNDDCFENVFARQVEGLGKKGDVFIGISTSGNSENVIMALNKAKELGLKTIVFLGKDGGKTKGLADVELIVDSDRTCRIQELHELCYHIICGLVEDNFS
jgi:D-sedoheptulose 7-phosphate isomerase